MDLGGQSPSLMALDGRLRVRAAGLLRAKPRCPVRGRTP